MATYSLWTEPWIPVQTLEGTSTRVSMRDALIRAHSLRAIADPSPLITVAIHRLLIALVHLTHNLTSLNDWVLRWQTGQFDVTAIDTYGHTWADRFDLLHPTRPFYQVPYIPEEKVHPVAALAIEAASGNNPALFDHGKIEGSDVLPLDRAACYLLAYQAFAVGGGISKPFNRMDAPLTKGLVVEITGRTLFETLMLNAMAREYWDEITPVVAEDKPFWEDDSPPEPDRNGTPVHGPLHYLTWQSRQIHLVVDPDQRVVTGCQIRQRYCLPKDGSRIDPGKCYFHDEKKGWQPRRLQKDRAAWRLTHVLLTSVTGKGDSLTLLTWLSNLRYRQKRLSTLDLPREVSFAVSGLTNDPKLAAKIELWRREEIGLPLAILGSPQLIERLNDLMEQAAWVERLLRRSTEALVWALSDRQKLRTAVTYLHRGRVGGDRLPPAATSLASGLGVSLAYWAAMERPFRNALFRLPEESPDALIADWQSQLRRNARAAFQAGITSLQNGGGSWEVLSTIRDSFERRISSIPADGKEVSSDDDDIHEADDE